MRDKCDFSQAGFISMFENTLAVARFVAERFPVSLQDRHACPVVMVLEMASQLK